MGSQPSTCQANGHFLAIAERGEVGGRARRVLRRSTPHSVKHLPQPCPTLRRCPRAASIHIAAAALAAPAASLVARLPQPQPGVGLAQDRHELLRILFAARSFRLSTHVNTFPFPRRVFCARGLLLSLRSPEFGVAERRETYGCLRGIRWACT